MDDVRTLLQDSGLGHSYGAEAATYSIDTCNLIPSCRHPGCIPLEVFIGKQQSVAHLHVFGARCWAKVPTVHGVQVTGGLKLDPHSVECWLLGYTSGNGNYMVQDIANCCVFVSQDVIFEEGCPHRTLASGGEGTNIPLFDTLETLPPANHDANLNLKDPAINDPETSNAKQCDYLDTEQSNQ